MQFHGYHTLEEISSALAVHPSWLVEEFVSFRMPKLEFDDGTEHYRSQDIEQFLRKRQIQICKEQTRLRGQLAELSPSAAELELELQSISLAPKHDAYDTEHIYRSIKA